MFTLAGEFDKMTAGELALLYMLIADQRDIGNWQKSNEVWRSGVANCGEDEFSRIVENIRAALNH